MTAAFGKTDRVLILKKPFDTVEVRQLAHALQRRWELARLASIKVHDLTALIDAQTAELRAANEALKHEASLREEALQRLGESNEQIRALAYQDGLTGLPNRRLFNEHLEKVLARSRRKGTEFAVLFIDIDNFKLINDTIGHQAADEVLRELADSLSLLIRTDDLLGLYHEEDVDTAATISIEPIHDSVLSRLGGDEFIVLLPDTRDRFAAGTVARRILQHLEQPIRVDGHEVFVSASIGIATYPEDGLSSEILIRNADTAMYHAKQQGKAAFQYYSAAMNAASVERLTLETGLAARARGRQPRAPLPAASRRAHGPHHRRRGAAALAHPVARLHLADVVHPDRRGHGAHRAARRMGARPGLRAGGGMAEARASRGFRSP